MAIGFWEADTPYLPLSVSLAIQATATSAFKSANHGKPSAILVSLRVWDSLKTAANNRNKLLLSEHSDCNHQFPSDDCDPIYAKVSFPTITFPTSNSTLTSFSDLIVYVFPKDSAIRDLGRDYDLGKNSVLLEKDCCFAVGPAWKPLLQNTIESLEDNEALSYGYAVLNAQVEITTPVPLESVILSSADEDSMEFAKAHTPRISEWFKSNIDIIGQQDQYEIPISYLEEKSIDHNNKSNNLGNSCGRGTLNLTLVSCSPVLRGKWDPDSTSVIIVAYNTPQKSITVSNKPQSQTTQDLQTLIPTSSINLYFIEDDNENITEIDGFDVSNMHSLDRQSTCAFMSVDSLIRYGINSGDWVTIKPSCHDENENSLDSFSRTFHLGRIVRVFAYDGFDPESSNSIYVSKHLFINLLQTFPNRGIMQKSNPLVVQIQQADPNNQSYNLMSLNTLGSSSLTNFVSGARVGAGAVFSSGVKDTIKNNGPGLDSPLAKNSDYDSNIVFPTASNLVLSRISSPGSIKPQVERIANTKLKSWLSGSQKRVLRLGDIVCFGVTMIESITKNAIYKDVEAELKSTPIISSSDIQNSTDKTQGQSQDQDIPADSKLEYTLNTQLLNSGFSAFNPAASVFWVCFKVSEISAYNEQANLSTEIHDRQILSAYPTESNGSNINTKNSISNVPLAALLNAINFSQDLMVGRYGFTVDASQTQVLISGVCNTTIPYSILSNSSTNSIQLSPATSSTMPFSFAYNRLQKLMLASLDKSITKTGWTCSVVVRGAPNSGKKHLLSTVASALGFHVYPLRVSEILAKVNGKSVTAENVVEQYLDHCLQLVPCAIVFEGLDLLASHYDSVYGETAEFETAKTAKSLRLMFLRCMQLANKAHNQPLIIAGTFSTSSDETSASESALLMCFHSTIALNAPDEKDRLLLLKSVLANSPSIVTTGTKNSLGFRFTPRSGSGSNPSTFRKHPLTWTLSKDVNLEWISKQTASFFAGDIVRLISNARSHSWRRIQHLIFDKNACSTGNKKQNLHSRDIWSEGILLKMEDFEDSIAAIRSTMSDTLGVPKIPNVRWDDVGGLEVAKKDILDTIKLPLESPELIASGIHIRSGLLFYGPPGTGKTLLAKAIATECNLNFFSVKGPELLDMYIGESEANVRRVFQRAREASPCVVFFDELDSLAPKRGQFGDSGGVMDRVVSQLLAELDGMSGPAGGSSSSNGTKSGENSMKKKPSSDGAVEARPPLVFVIGATNRPDLLDSALLRPGRFDKMVYLGISNTHEAQLNILMALTRKLVLSPDLNLSNVAAKCELNLTGADLYALCSDAQLKATLRSIQAVDEQVEKWNQENNPSFNHPHSISQLQPETQSETQRIPEPDFELKPESGDLKSTQTASAVKHPYPMTPSYFLDHIASDQLKKVVIKQEDFETALAELVPSVSFEELERYQKLKETF